VLPATPAVMGLPRQQKGPSPLCLGRAELGSYPARARRSENCGINLCDHQLWRTPKLCWWVIELRQITADVDGYENRKPNDECRDGQHQEIEAVHVHAIIPICPAGQNAALVLSTELQSPSRHSPSVIWNSVALSRPENTTRLLPFSAVSKTACSRRSSI
jgi:hypothetical protein